VFVPKGAQTQENTRDAPKNEFEKSAQAIEKRADAESVRKRREEFIGAAARESDWKSIYHGRG
jgi:hypothetical protein